MVLPLVATITQSAKITVLRMASVLFLIAGVNVPILLVASLPTAMPNIQDLSQETLQLTVRQLNYS
jgi:mannose/fructose-specific phosphotransferase system component IIA